MARFSNIDRKPVDDVVDRWRAGCLIDDGSLLFPGEHLWTAELVEELYRNFNEDKLEDHDRSFEEKFQVQLEDTSQGCVRLAGEVVVIYFLFAHVAVNGHRKRELLNTILGWKGDSLPEGDISDAMDAGIGNPGQFFNNGRPNLIEYLVAFTRRFKALERPRREELLTGDPWEFKSWLSEGDGGEQMMRHILLHLLFPDHFERIASGNHKSRIHETLIGLVHGPDSDGEDGDTETEEDIDRQLYAIRQKLEELMPDGQADIDGNIDFYSSPLREAWGLDDSDDDDIGAGITNLDALEFKRQVVLYGPPGTGKTYEAKDLARRVIYHQALRRWGAVPYLSDTELIEATIDRQVRRLQLHQAYAYEDFVRGLRMTPKGTVPTDGYLLRLVRDIAESRKESLDRPPLPWVVILDELNRTDVSRLFGELFSLLEDRDQAIDLPALGDDDQPRSVRLPEDLYFIGTMNLIDQSVEQLDFALRRRFLWIRSSFEAELIPAIAQERWAALATRNDDVGRRVQHNPSARFQAELDLLAERAQELNQRIASSNLLGEQYEIGHTYFFDITTFLAGWPRIRSKGQRPKTYLWSKNGPQPPVRDLWVHSLRPLLSEYLSGVDTEMRNEELAQLRAVLFTPPPE